MMAEPMFHHWPVCLEPELLFTMLPSHLCVKLNKISPVPWKSFLVFIHKIYLLRKDVKH